MLPSLPKKNKKKEADFGLKFRDLIESNPPMASYPFELKDTRGLDYFNFNLLEEDQIYSALRNKSEKGNLIRIVSGTRGAADYVYFKNCKYSFVVIKYPKGYVFIDIDDFLKEKKTSGKRRSLTYDRAKEIATLVF